MGRKTNHEKRYENSGRPTVITEEVLEKLEYAFRHSFSDKEACLHANISTSALYHYQEKNPEYKERKALLKLSPNMAAKEELVDNIKGNLEHSKWWVGKKIPEEFGEKSLIQINNQTNIDKIELGADVEEVVTEFNEIMRPYLIKEPKPIEIEEVNKKEHEEKDINNDKESPSIPKEDKEV